MDAATISERASQLANSASKLAGEAANLAQQSTELVVTQSQTVASDSTFLSLFTVFVLACFIGYFVVWSVTPALHSPLMGVTNAISSVIIVGGILAAGPVDVDFSKITGFLAVTLASVNIFGGFIVTQRMLAMFKKKKK